MSSIEINKIIGALLLAGLVAHITGTISQFLVHPHHMEAEAAIPTGSEGGGAQPAKPAPIEPVSPLMANADPAQGQTIAKKCATCHSFDQGGAAKVGPNLWGILGNHHAHMEGFAYSTAMAALKDKIWDYEELNQFLANPKAHIPGTKMGFAGLKKPEERADVIAYLRSLADGPLALPDQAAIDAANQAYAAAKQAAAAPAEEASAAEPSTSDAGTQEAAASQSAVDIMALIKAADPAKGQSIAKKCVTCHTFDQGGAAKVGPNLWNVVGGPHAHMQGFNYSAAMKASTGSWDYASLDQFLTSPKAYIPGTKMSFAGLKKPEDRAAVIAYLRSLSDNPVPLP
jgi:cytochrome c